MISIRVPTNRRRFLLPFCFIKFHKFSNSIAVVSDYPADDADPQIITDLNSCSNNNDTANFISLRGDNWFKNVASKLGTEEIDATIKKLCLEDADNAIEIFFFLQNELGVKHSRFSQLIIAHILAGKHRPRALQSHLRQMLLEDGSGSASSLCELLYNTFRGWDSNNLVWDMLAFVYCRSNKVHGALIVLAKMKDLDIKPSIMAYNSLLHNLKHMDIIIMWDVYRKIKASGICPSECTNSIILDGLCKQSFIREAVLFLQETKDEETEPSVVSFNTVMSGICKMGLVDIAKSFFCMMFKCGLSPDVYSYNIIIHGLCVVGSMEEALGFAMDMKKHGLGPDEVTYDIIARGFRRSILLGQRMKGAVFEARSYFDELANNDLVEDILLYNTMIDKYAKLGDIGDAMQLCKTAIAKGISPTIVTFNSLIYGLCKAGRSADAMKFLKYIKMQGFKPTVVTYTTLMNAFCEEGNLEATFELCEEMEANAVQATQVTYTVVMKALCRGGKPEEYNEILFHMINKGLSPDQTFFNVLIQYFCKARDMKMAFHLLDEMAKHNLQPNHITYNILINGLCVYGDLKDADKLFSLLKDRNIRLSKVAYTTMIKAHCAKGDVSKAWVLFNQMIERGFEISVRDYGAVINRLCKRGLVDGSKLFLQMMLVDGISIDQQICKRLLHSFDQIGDFSSRFQLYALMIKCGFDPG